MKGVSHFLNYHSNFNISFFSNCRYELLHSDYLLSWTGNYLKESFILGTFFTSKIHWAFFLSEHLNVITAIHLFNTFWTAKNSNIFFWLWKKGVRTEQAIKERWKMRLLFFFPPAQLFSFVGKKSPLFLHASLLCRITTFGENLIWLSVCLSFFPFISQRSFLLTSI